jgi:hypothetical protein
MTQKQRNREILFRLIKAAEDIENGNSKAKSDITACRPYLRGAFAKQFGRKVPTDREVAKVTLMDVVDFL